MSADAALVLALVAGAAGWLGIRGWRILRRRRGGCAGGCGCSARALSGDKPGR